MSRKEKFEKVFNYLEKQHPVAETELEYTNPFELLVEVILSAQCTDKRVNMTVPALFAAYPTAEIMATALPEDIYPYIKSISYPNSKAKYLANMSRMLVKDFGGEVPSDVKELQKLPGVGRKTANVIASVVYNLPALAVDTHVFRVSARLGLTVKAKNPLQTEKQLMKYIPPQKIPMAHHWLILHGRYICTARNPKCFECGLRKYCLYFAKNVVLKDEGRRKKDVTVAKRRNLF
jgi:endonuclease III